MMIKNYMSPPDIRGAFNRTVPVNDVMESVKKRIEKLVSDGVFGNFKILAVENNSDNGKAAQFASELYFLRLFLETIESNSKTRLTKLPIVVKVQVSAAESKLMSTDDQFANEVNTYEHILPKLGVTDLVPLMHYGFATNGRRREEDIIILEDLRPKGFKIADETLLDCDHVVLAMKKLGEFHGHSYKLKKTSPKDLQDVSQKIIPRKFIASEGLFEGFLFRAFKPFVESSPKYSIVSRAYAKITNSGILKVSEALFSPAEPFAAVIHGDFNRNNLFYRYENDTVVEVKFFDFGVPAYSNPAIDISFLLYMNTSSQLRDEHWDDFFEAYWTGLTGVEPNPGFTFDAFMKDFAKRALWGCHIASFFLPMMLYPETLVLPEKMVQMSPEEKFDWGLNAGGEKVTKLTSSIVKHLLDRGYVEEFLLNLTI